MAVEAFKGLAATLMLNDHDAEEDVKALVR